MENKRYKRAFYSPLLLLKERDSRMFKVNNSDWYLRFTEPYSDMLKRSDGTYTLGVTDNNLKTIFLSDRLSGYMLDKVVCHELCHVYAFENDCNFDIQTEEIIADFMSLFGRDIIYMLDDLMKILKKVA